MDVVDRKIFGLLRAAFIRGGSPETLGRGIAAGVFGAYFPSASLRFGIAFFSALFFRGNKAIALIPPFLAALIENGALLHAQVWAARLLWKRSGSELAAAAERFAAANNAWEWVHPWRSVLDEVAVWTGMSGHAWVPLLVVIGVSGTVAAILSYPVSVTAFTFFYAAQIHARQLAESGRPALPAFVIPAAGAAPVTVGNTDLRREYCGKYRRFIAAPCVRLLIDGGQAYPEMLAAIDAAKTIVVLETYIVRADATGERFAQALLRARKRGVHVRFLYDGVGSMSLPEEYVLKLLEGGLEVRVYHPFRSVWKGGYSFLQKRDHRKILVADGSVSMIGGLNLADEYDSAANGGGGWRDTHVRIDGEASARQLLRIFEEGWTRAEIPYARRPSQGLLHALARHHEQPKSGEACAPGLPCDLSSEKPTSQDVPLQVISNHELLSRIIIKRAYLKAFRAARRYILIENAFFIPDRDVLRALYAAVRRGVAVGVVVAMRSDVGIAALASRALYDELLAHGVRLFEYPLSMIHSKVAAIDDCWSIVSSYNLNHRSLHHDLEVGALFFDAKFATALKDAILKDIAACNEISKEIHRARPWNIALTESMCYQFRYWL